MNAVIKGNVKEITDLFESQTSDFKKKSLIVTSEGEYPQTIEVEFINKKVELLDIVNEGESIEVSVNIRGREWVNPQGETKYFTSLAGWKIDIK